MYLLPENIINLSAAVVQPVNWPALHTNQVTLDVLRLDKIDPVISGNKWFKLKYYLEDAVQKKHRAVLTFGGAWSNHIVATACAAKKTGLQSIGVIRGEKPVNFSQTLSMAAGFGMQLVFVSRETYSRKDDPLVKEKWLKEFDRPYLIPEGGAGDLGIKGATEICSLIDLNKYTDLICAVGTGTLLAGLERGCLAGQQLTGIAVLKGFEDVSFTGIGNGQSKKTTVVHDYHFGGYAKKNQQLIDFMNQFYDVAGIPTDFVYTAKLFFAITDLVYKNYFPSARKLLAIHSGGLQGNNSLPPKKLHF